MEEKTPKENQTVNQLIGCQDEPTILNSTAPKIKIPEWQTQEQYHVEDDLITAMMATNYFGDESPEIVRSQFKLFVTVNDNYFDDSQIFRIYKFLDDIENSNLEEVNYFVKKIIKEVKRKQKEAFYNSNNDNQEKNKPAENENNIYPDNIRINFKIDETSQGNDGKYIFYKILYLFKFKNHDNKIYFNMTQTESIKLIISIFEFLKDENLILNGYIINGHRRWSTLNKIFCYQNNKTGEFKKFKSSDFLNIYNNCLDNEKEKFQSEYYDIIDDFINNLDYDKNV